MRRRRSGHLLRWLLATMILVAGLGSPVRYGHAHAHHGEHGHHGGAADHDHDHDGRVVVAALPALVSGAFHWHEVFALPFGLTPPDADGTPTQVVGTTPWASGDVLAGTSTCWGWDAPSLTVMAFDRPPPPSLRPAFRIPSESAPLAASHLVLGAVPLRC